MLLALDEGPVGGEDLTLLLTDDGGGVGRLQPAGENPRPRLLDLLVECVDVLERLLHVLFRRRGLALDHVHRQQVVAHLVLLRSDRPAADLSPPTRTPATEIDRIPEIVDGVLLGAPVAPQAGDTNACG